MAIAFGGALGQATTAGSNTVSITGLQVSGSDLAIVVAVTTEITSVDVSTLKYDDGAGGGEQNFIQIGAYQNIEAGNFRNSLWRLVAPNTGSGRRIICVLTGTSNVNMGAVYYSGVDQTTPTADPTNGGDTASPGATTNTSDLDGSWHASFIWGNGALAITSGGVKRQDVQNAADIGILADSNATVASASTNTINFTWNDSNDGGFNSCMLRPVGVAATGGSLLLMGVGN